MAFHDSSVNKPTTTAPACEENSQVPPSLSPAAGGGPWPNCSIPTRSEFGRVGDNMSATQSSHGQAAGAPAADITAGVRGGMRREIARENAHCDCLLRQAELLCSLRKCNPSTSTTGGGERQSQPLLLGKILPIMQDAFRAWDALFQCRGDCSVGNDHEVLLLAAMCVRATLALLSRLSWGDDDKTTVNSSDSDTSTGRGGVREKDWGLSQQRQPPAGRRAFLPAYSSSCSPTASASPPPPPSRTQILIDGFEVAGDERLVLLQLLRSLILRQLDSVTANLRSMLYRRKAVTEVVGSSNGGGSGPDTLPSSSQFTYIEQVMSSISSLRDLLPPS
ncbi:hypothetical protein B0J12DRAFT_704813 [Macrophomina phaseolina]|uniref:Uncharacterized protein n=1 Tax=Macrophomina phaseolina TaxID=35725 RepID=A0ABQ8FU71_9PEZI|nr:hypothetical protein B0J12DRAFT_704813 [Macrophomina phaseolina]